MFPESKVNYESWFPPQNKKGNWDFFFSQNCIFTGDIIARYKVRIYMKMQLCVIKSEFRDVAYTCISEKCIISFITLNSDLISHNSALIKK